VPTRVTVGVVEVICLSSPLQAHVVQMRVMETDTEAIANMMYYVALLRTADIPVKRLRPLVFVAAKPLPSEFLRFIAMFPKVYFHIGDLGRPDKLLTRCLARGEMLTLLSHRYRATYSGDMGLAGMNQDNLSLLVDSRTLLTANNAIQAAHQVHDDDMYIIFMYVCMKEFSKVVSLTTTTLTPLQLKVSMELNFASSLAHLSQLSSLASVQSKSPTNLFSTVTDVPQPCFEHLGSALSRRLTLT
jgi:hypothetical protein